QEAASCIVKEACFADKFPAHHATTSGLAYSAKRNLLVVGDFAERRLLFFRPHSCFHLQYLRSEPIPQKIKKLTSIYIDHEDMLWLSSDQPDDYHNGSVYVWAKDKW